VVGDPCTARKITFIQQTSKLTQKRDDAMPLMPFDPVR
jgi:hypothetical protein